MSMMELVIAMMKLVKDAFGPAMHALQTNVDLNAGKIKIKIKNTKVILGLET